MDKEFIEEEETQCTCGRSTDGICYCSVRSCENPFYESESHEEDFIEDSEDWE